MDWICTYSPDFLISSDISEHLTQKSVVAMLDSGQPWDMHRPLPESCELQFLNTTDKNPWTSNNTFWRSCSFMLGAVVSEAFREDIPVILHSFPSPNGWLLKLLIQFIPQIWILV